MLVISCWFSLCTLGLQQTCLQYQGKLLWPLEIQFPDLQYKDSGVNTASVTGLYIGKLNESIYIKQSGTKLVLKISCSFQLSFYAHHPHSGPGSFVSSVLWTEKGKCIHPRIFFTGILSKHVRAFLWTWWDSSRLSPLYVVLPFLHTTFIQGSAFDLGIGKKNPNYYYTHFTKSEIETARSSNRLVSA